MIRWPGECIDQVKKQIDRMKAKRAEQKILEKHGFEAYCPKCKKGLNGTGSFVSDDENGLKAVCIECGAESIWNVDLFPFPVLVSVDGIKTEANYPTPKEIYANVGKGISHIELSEDVKEIIRNNNG